MRLFKFMHRHIYAKYNQTNVEKWNINSAIQNCKTETTADFLHNWKLYKTFIFPNRRIF